MSLIKTQILFNIFLLFFSINVLAQKNFEMDLIITDTIVIGKNYPYATKVNLEININDFQSTILLYYFYNPVSPFLSLSYILEDENNNIVPVYPDWYSLLYKDPTNEPKCMSTGFFVNSKQKIIRKRVPNRKSNDYDFAKYEINSSKQNDAIYLMLSWYHKDLPKGTYWLYLTYSFPYSSGRGVSYIVNDSRTFKGTVVSNKVKLIVE